MTFASTFGRTFSPTFQPSSQAAAGGIVVYDTFTDTDATLLKNHMPDIYPAGSVWTPHNASYNYTITGNKVYGNSYSAFVPHVIECGASDVQIDVTMSSYYTLKENLVRQPGICFRYSSGTFLLALANYSASEIQIVDSSQNILASTTWTSRKQGTGFAAQVVLSGSTITVTIDGCEVSTTSTINQTATMHGLHIYNADAWMDDLTITAL